MLATEGCCRLFPTKNETLPISSAPADLFGKCKKVYLWSWSSINLPWHMDSALHARMGRHPSTKTVFVFVWWFDGSMLLCSASLMLSSPSRDINHGSRCVKMKASLARYVMFALLCFGSLQARLWAEFGTQGFCCRLALASTEVEQI